MHRGIVAVSAAAALLALSGCAGDGVALDDQSRSLTIWVDDDRQEPVARAVEQFTEDTGVEVEIVLRNYEEIRNDFISQVPTGEGPDITVGANDWLGELAVNGVISPIEPGELTEEMEPVSLEAFTYEGQTWAVPYAIENLALIRNTAMTDVTPETWDEAVEVGEELDADYPILLQMDTEGDPYMMYPMQTSFGAEVFEQAEDGSYEPEIAMGGEPGAEFAQWLDVQGQARVLDTAVTFDIAREAFANEESPYLISGPWILPEVEHLDVAVEPIPRPGDQEALPFVGAQGFYISSQTESPLLAAELVTDYLASHDAQVAMFEAGGRTPALQSAAEVAAEDPRMDGFAQVGAEGLPMPGIPEMAIVFDYWGVAHAQIVDGRSQDPAVTWEQTVDTIQAQLDD